MSRTISVRIRRRREFCDAGHSRMRRGGNWQIPAEPRKRVKRRLDGGYGMSGMRAREAHEERDLPT